ncbi:pyridoxal kinase [Leptinotarsa decemlineata]|uniref:pyridoxal kinase n=1 Tax=Leptinotarsa decemlineata TaxID=7539 RepID=UPI000C254887|nr:pyridoxal kinase [Leptinotarsa decemlineata]
MTFTPRVLSIQSHVVSGYVGNKSAVFPMQLLGLEVDFINSVQLSTHTGYKCVKGQILSEKDLADLVEGLVANNIDFYSHLLTGYIGSESFLKQVITVIKHLKEKNPDLVYACDPVMGDHGKLYVPKELVPIYKETVLSLANIITPNLFETELLTDMRITKIDDVWKAIEILHEKGCQTVVISSAEIGQNKDTLSVFASTKKGDSTQKLSMQLKKLPINFIGTGDLFAALFLSWMHKSSYNLKESLEKTIATLQAVLKRTSEGLQDRDLTPRNIELKLVQSKLDIEKPKIIQEATVVQ